MNTQDVLKRQRELFSRSVNEWVKDRALCRVLLLEYDECTAVAENEAGTRRTDLIEYRGTRYKLVFSKDQTGHPRLELWFSNTPQRFAVVSDTVSETVQLDKDEMVLFKQNADLLPILIKAGWVAAPHRKVDSFFYNDLPVVRVIKEQGED